MTTTATITDPERAAAWRAVFGSDTVPVLSFVPSWATLPGLDGPQLVYMLDLRAITPEQRERLVARTAERFGRDPAEVEADLDSQGMPILAEQVMVASTDFGLLMSMVDDDPMPVWEEAVHWEEEEEDWD